MLQSKDIKLVVCRASFEQSVVHIIITQYETVDFYIGSNSTRPFCYIKWLFCGIWTPHVKGFGCFRFLAFSRHHKSNQIRNMFFIFILSFFKFL